MMLIESVHGCMIGFPVRYFHAFPLIEQMRKRLMISDEMVAVTVHLSRLVSTNQVVGANVCGVGELVFGGGGSSQTKSMLVLNV
jgi:hypothetical protein